MHSQETTVARAEAGKATTRDLARHAGVSVGTVSNVLNHPDRVAPETAEKVYEAIRALGFVRNESARALRAGQSNAIGLVLLSDNGPFFTDLAHAVEDSAERTGGAVLHATTRYDHERESRYLRLFEEQRVRGLIVMSIDGPNETLHAIDARGIPVVLLFHTDAPGFSSAAVDNREGGRLAVEHLLERGHRRIVFAGGPLTRHGTRERLEGARDAARGHADLSLLETREMTFEDGFEAGHRIAAMTPADRPSAVFAANDFIAIGIQQVAQEHGLDVPGDLAIIGFDDSESSLRGSSTLTSIRQPTRRLGEVAIELLTERLHTPGSPHRHVLLTPMLVERESTAAR